MQAARCFFTETEDLENVVFRFAHGGLSDLFWEIENPVKNRTVWYIQTILHKPSWTQGV